MTEPAWLAGTLCAAMLLIAAGSVVRLAIWRLRGRAAEPEADALHVLMGVAMAGMLEPRMSLVPGAFWRVVFAAGAAWFAWRAIRVRSRGNLGNGRSAGWGCAHPAPHIVECVAMIYMLMPAGAGSTRPSMAMPGMSGTTATANPAFAIVLALFMLGYIVWTADRLTSAGQPGTGAPAHAGETLAPRAAAFSRIAMSLAMGYMLLMTL
jgi:hypothetical protein